MLSKAQSLADATKLEEITTRIYQMLSPDHIVVHNDHINGRQIDVSIRANVSGHEILIIVNAKNQTRRVNVNQVGELFAVMDDVKAYRGVIICNKGFTQGAKKFAKDRGIDLCHIHDAESKDWKTELRFPVILEEVFPTLNFNYKLSLAKNVTLSQNPIVSVSGTNIFEKILAEWNRGEISTNEDLYSYHLEQEDASIQTLECEDIPIKNLNITVTIKRYFYLGYFDQLPTAKALINSITGKTELIIPLSDMQKFDSNSLIKISSPETAPVPTIEYLRILRVPSVKFEAMNIAVKKSL